MPASPRKSTIFANALRSLLLIASLSSVLQGCQTLADQADAGTRDKEVIESQKALVRNALDTGKPDQALKTLRDLLRGSPDDAALNNLMGLTQLALKNPNRAVTHFMRAYKEEHSIAIALNLSSGYIENGDFNKAASLLTAMLKQADKDKYQYKERIYHNLGYAHVRLHQLTQATSWFKEALDENPTFFPSYLELARVYEKTKRPAMAAKTYARATDYCQSCFEPVYSLAMIYMKMGKYLDARQILVKYNKNEGITATDRAAAQRLLKLVNNSAQTGPRNG